MQPRSHRTISYHSFSLTSVRLWPLIPSRGEFSMTCFSVHRLQKSFPGVTDSPFPELPLQLVVSLGRIGGSCHPLRGYVGGPLVLTPNGHLGGPIPYVHVVELPWRAVDDRPVQSPRPRTHFFSKSPSGQLI